MSLGLFGSFACYLLLFSAPVINIIIILVWGAREFPDKDDLKDKNTAVKKKKKGDWALQFFLEAPFPIAGTLWICQLYSVETPA